MSETATDNAPALLREYPWRLSYSTSGQAPDGRPVDILHDFYVPALRRAIQYDRVAGYFRSSSLAAASQGFSAFVANGGAARMVVGCDLDAEDVRAILAGGEAALASRLNRELASPEQWPDCVQRGVELLAWMVAHDYLEVRVAFRVHAESGEPLVVDSVADGYVHEKWAVLRDAAGDRLYVTGSFNESRTALVCNAENIDVHRDWTSEENRHRADDAEARFARIWRDESPSLRVLTLPEAVRQRLLQIAEQTDRPLEIDGSSEIPLAVAPPSSLERLRFALLREGPRLPNGRYVGMVTAPVEPWPHQAVVAKRLIDTWPYSYLLCDEVGLGKTIEAGLAIRSLVLSGLARRVLISPPASLTAQWQREMASKFFLPFARALTGAQPRHQYLIPIEAEQPADSLYAPDLAIVSTGLLARADRRPELEKAQPFDIALVDEAHYARRKNATQGTRVEPRFGTLYQTLDQVLRGKAKALLLATATPMQLDPVEVADLIRLTRRVGPFQDDPTLINSYYELLGKLVRDEPLEPTENAFLRRAVDAVKAQDPLLWDYVERAVLDSFSRYDVGCWLDSGAAPMGGEEGVRRLVFAVAPLSRVMLRHTRPLLELYRARGKLRANLARRVVLPLQPVRLTPQEEAAYHQLEAYCTGLAAQMGKTGQGKKNALALGMILSFLRLRFASSLFAIRESLRRRAQKVEATLKHLAEDAEHELDEQTASDLLEDGEGDEAAVGLLLKDRTPDDLTWERDHLKAMLADLGDLTGTASKMQRLLEYLAKRRRLGGRIEQTVVFTRFYDTLTDIVARLRRADPQMLIGTYSGQGGSYLNPRTGRMSGVDREEIKHRFLRGELDVLVCTDAAAEGLNLQTADLLVNFDLPWNPMKVEQRIGRIDRIGQRHPTIYVSNLCYLGSAEEIVYGRLLARLSQAGNVVGTQQISLLPVTPEEFQELAQGTLKEGELEKRALERAALARRRQASMEIPPEELYGIYQRLSEHGPDEAPPVDLDAIWHALSTSRYLRQLGCRIHPDPAARCLLLNNIPGVPDGTALTVSREHHESGIPELEGLLHFATYGEPMLDALMSHLASFELPPCVRHLMARDPELDMEMAAFAVAEVGGAHRLVRRYADLVDLQIDEDRAIAEPDTRPLLAQLEAVLENEADRRRGAKKIESLNERVGRSQRILACLVVRNLMRGRQKTGSGATNFWQELQAMEQAYAERPFLRIHGVPADLGRRLAMPLFAPELPTVGAEGYVDAPGVLLRSAFDAAARVGDSFHAKKDDLIVDEVIGRLTRELRND